MGNGLRTYLQIHNGAANESDQQKYGTGHLKDFNASMSEEITGQNKCATGAANRDGQQGYSAK